MQKLTVTDKYSGVRADVFVASHNPKFSRSSLKLLFMQGLVNINGKPAKPGHKLRPGQTISIDKSALTKRPPKIELPIIYEDKDVIVIDKPSGILTHSKGAINTEATVASFIRPKLTDKPSSNRAGIVHRLDRETSGVIIAAKNESVRQWLQKQFANRKVKKTYLAVLEGKPKEPTAIIDAPIARNPKKPQTFKVSSLGKTAQTKYRLIKSMNINDKIYSLVELSPETGRTHQLRVHCSFIGHSIVGDSVYGKAGGQMRLHAKNLEIKLPNGVLKKFEAPLSAKFKEFV
ncbi:hypothetical protein A3F65_03935 [Candidatus Saccharibacteria bacterium RIFCSPHIGHO2_12_FULL_47_16b]|nr:MAG: hypothetical protein A3F65_03935 [Candidatus Saccharibacteria bacterium RIFCSPHIGHO2_12_FULL_47_16b]